MRKIIFLLALVSAMSSCKTMYAPAEKGQMTLSGTIEESGMTTYQYGTHVLKGAAQTYALRSTTVKLGEYIGKNVKLKGVKIEGYPVENGPDYIEVKEVALKGQ
ncbi:hypothetical protein ACSBL2_06560 [Pedobacter sp. AW31-3R]|uniref:hypothetical protein n=1 Tax=Pedobacter sp. AW31-3R TaxID=3445781 RepID=UPI003FA1157A